MFLIDLFSKLSDKLNYMLVIWCLCARLIGCFWFGYLEYELLDFKNTFVARKQY